TVSKGLQTGRARALTRRLTTFGGSSVGASASQGCAVIHPIASFSEANFPKWCTVPLGHIIRTRQTCPLRTGDKAAALPTGKTVYSAACRRFSLSSSSLSPVLALSERPSLSPSSL